MNQSEIIELQHRVFNEVAKKLNEQNKIPLKINLGPMNDKSRSDIEELKEKHLLAWDLPFKANPLFPAVSDPASSIHYKHKK
jgi:hypothetical protein